jgi:hypothetical protein
VTLSSSGATALTPAQAANTSDPAYQAAVAAIEADVAAKLGRDSR